MVKPYWRSPPVQVMATGLPSSVAREDLLEFLAALGVGRVDRAAQRHQFFVARTPRRGHDSGRRSSPRRSSPRTRMVWRRRRHALQTLGHHLHPVLGVRRELAFRDARRSRGGCEARTHLHRRLDHDVRRASLPTLASGITSLVNSTLTGEWREIAPLLCRLIDAHPARVRRAGFGARRVLGAAAAGDEALPRPMQRARWRVCESWSLPKGGCVDAPSVTDRDAVEAVGQLWQKRESWRVVVAGCQVFKGLRRELSGARFARSLAGGYAGGAVSSLLATAGEPGVSPNHQRVPPRLTPPARRPRCSRRRPLKT